MTTPETQDAGESARGHTPGPWLYRPQEYDDWGIVRSGLSVICQARDPERWSAACLDEHRRRGTDPWEANARLIAAAPDLLLALKHCLGWIDSWSPEFTDDAEWPEYRAAFDAAVAKAEGRE